MEFRIEISSEKLRRNRIIQGVDIGSMAKEAAVQLAIWERIEQSWTNNVAELTRLETLYIGDPEYYVGKDRLRKFSKEIATKLTTEAQNKLTGIQKILHGMLDCDPYLDWKQLVDNFSFDKPRPQVPENITIPVSPQDTDEQYEAKLSIFDYIQPWKIKNKLAEMKSIFKNDYEDWQRLKQEIEVANSELEKNYRIELIKWQEDKKRAEKDHKQRIENLETGYRGKSPEAVIEYCNIVLSRSQYPISLPKYFEMEYKKDSGILVLDYLLPSLEHLPKVKEIKYVQARDCFSEVLYSRVQIEKLYDDLVYQITLGNLYLLFKADIQNTLESIVFNGIVEHIDQASGQEAKTCIISIHAKRTEFLSINLKRVDPRTCFKSLKGIGSSKLHALTPIPPLSGCAKLVCKYMSHNGNIM